METKEIIWNRVHNYEVIATAKNPMNFELKADFSDKKYVGGKKYYNTIVIKLFKNAVAENYRISRANFCQIGVKKYFEIHVEKLLNATGQDYDYTYHEAENEGFDLTGQASGPGEERYVRVIIYNNNINHNDEFYTICGQPTNIPLEFPNPKTSASKSSEDAPGLTPDTEEGNILVGKDN